MSSEQTSEEIVGEKKEINKGIFILRNYLGDLFGGFIWVI
jgi:hypothetical protein